MLAQFYYSYGAPHGPNVIVNGPSWGVQRVSNQEIPPDIAVNDYGEFAVAWTGGGNIDHYGLWARVYNNAGAGLSLPIYYSDYHVFNYNLTARVSAGPGHEFLGTWYTAGAADPDIYTQKFNFLGSLVGLEQQINSDLSGQPQSYPGVAVHDNTLVLVWEDERNGNNNNDIFAKFLNWPTVGGLCGDINGDGTGPDISDMTHLVDYLFAGGPPPVMLNAADLNGSGEIDIADLTYFVEFLFGGGPAPSC